MRLFPSIVLVLAATLLASDTSAQVRELWAERHDAPPMLTDTAAAAAVDAAGTIYVTGVSWSSTQPWSRDIETVAYSATGTLLWRARWDSRLQGDDTPHAIAVDPATNDVIVAGTAVGLHGGIQVIQMAIVRYTSAGALVWSRLRGNMGAPNSARAIAIDANGAIFLTGEGGTGPWGDVAVVKLDANGNDVWSAAIDGPGHQNDYGIDIALGPQGSVYACGTMFGLGTGSDMAVVKLDAAGATQWVGTFDGGVSGSDRAHSLVVDAQGRAYAAGESTTLAPPQDSQDAQVVAWNSDGTFAWEWSRNGPANSVDILLGIELDPFGRLAVGGFETGLQFSNALAAVIETNGTPVWVRTWNGPLYGYGLAVDAHGTVVVAGLGGNDAKAVGWDAQGTRSFVYAYPGAPTRAMFVGIASPAAGDFVAFGRLGFNTANEDFLVVRLQHAPNAFCFGDGSSTPCPCGNASATLELAGCAHSSGIGGRVADRGAPSLSADTLVLEGGAMPSSPALYVQGTSAIGGGLGAVFGDGLSCVGGMLVRIGTKQNVDGASQYPEAGDVPISVRGGITQPGERTYQVRYRNAAAFCTPATFNLTNGVRVTWTP